MALTPQQELQIREELETNPNPKRELALREQLEGQRPSPVRPQKSTAQQLIDSPLGQTLVQGARQSLPTVENLGLLGERVKGFGRFLAGVPQGLQEGGAGLLQAAGDISPFIPGAGIVGGAGLINEEDVKRGKDVITRFQNRSNRAFETSPITSAFPITGAAIDLGSGGSGESFGGRVVGRALPAVLGTKGLGRLPEAITGARGLLARIGVGGGTGFSVGGTQFLPGDEARLEAAGTGTLFGGGLPIAASALGAARTPVQSILRATLGKNIRKELKTEFSKRGERLNQAIAGGKLPFGPITGSKTVKAFEAQALSSPGQLQKAIPKLNEVNREIIKSTQRGLNKIKTGPVTPTTVGNKLKENFNNSLIILKGHRKLAANRDFGAINKLSNNQTIFVSTKNTRDAFARVSKQIELAGEKGRFMVTIANRLAKKKGVSLQELLQMRSRMSSASKGGKTLWKEFTDSEQKRFAAKAMTAIDKDILRLANSKKGDLNKSIRTALKNYKDNSQTLNSIEGTAYGRILGGKEAAPDVIAKRVLALSPDELREGMKIAASRGGARTVAIVQKLYIKNIINQSKGMGTDVAGQLNFSPRLASELFIMDKKRFFSLFPTVAMRRQVADSFDAIRRLGTLPEGGGALTPAQLQVEVARNVISKNAIFSVGTLAKAIPPGVFRKALFTEEGRKALITIARPLKGQITTSVLLTKWNQEFKSAKKTFAKLREENNGN